MAIYKCKKCGSTIEYEQGATFVVCGSCGTKQMLPHPDDDRQTSLYGYANVEPLLKRAFMFLEDEEWEKADAYCEKVLDNDPENAQAYLGKLMAEQHVQRQDELTNCRSPFDESKNYQKIIRFGDEKLKTELRGYIDSINERIECERLTNIYNSAISEMKEANTESEFKAVAETFKTITGFKDADVLIGQCLDKAEVCRKDAIYASGKSQMTGNAVNGYESAIKTFSTISGWKDTDKQIDACRKRIEEIKAKDEADRLEASRKDKERRIAAEKYAKKKKKIFAITIPIIIVCIAFIIVLTTIIIPNGKYNDAVELYNAGKYDEAITAFTELNGYKDSETQITKCETAIKDQKYNNAIEQCNAGNYLEAYDTLINLNGYKDSAAKAKEIYVQYKVAKLKTAKCGEYVVFGSYEQDNNTSNGKEDIEWQVLTTKEDKVLVISRYALECKEYNNSWAHVTWETCSLRKWMNETFISNAFSAEEKDMIQSTTVTADKNPSSSESSGNNTIDKVFLLSITEVTDYLNGNELRKCAPTNYANAQREKTSDSCIWWLRSPGKYLFRASNVAYSGYVDEYGNEVDDSDVMFRPAMWINFGS